LSVLPEVVGLAGRQRYVSLCPEAFQRLKIRPDFHRVSESQGIPAHSFANKARAK
jgi:hypothetical protein